MKFSSVLYRSGSDATEPLAVEPICLPELGVFGVMRGLTGNAGPRPPLDAARAALSLSRTAAIASAPERRSLVVSALQRAMQQDHDYALEIVFAAFDEENAYLASLGTCAAHAWREGRYERLTELDALPGGPRGGYFIVTKYLSSSGVDASLVDVPFRAEERLALVSPRVSRALDLASPRLTILGSSSSGQAMFLCELSSDLAEADACVVMVERA